MEGTPRNSCCYTFGVVSTESRGSIRHTPHCLTKEIWGVGSLRVWVLCVIALRRDGVNDSLAHSCLLFHKLLLYFCLKLKTCCSISQSQERCFGFPFVLQKNESHPFFRDSQVFSARTKEKLLSKYSQMGRTVPQPFIGLELCFYSLFIFSPCELDSPSALAIKVVTESTWNQSPFN